MNKEKYNDPTAEAAIANVIREQKAAHKTILTLEVKDKDGFLVGIFKGYQNAAEALGLDEKTIRNITLGKFKSNRKGYTITAIAKGGDAL